MMTHELKLEFYLSWTADGLYPDFHTDMGECYEWLCEMREELKRKIQDEDLEEMFRIDAEMKLEAMEEYTLGELAHDLVEMVKKDIE